ncbi:hypothetical protein C8J56DRAFT_900782 [Mycena floridula]|nr:hypothetical protein C8J56DRAFT_900782 [Mycena floridula]
MGRAKKTRSSTSTIAAPQMATSLPFHLELVPAIQLWISGNSPVIAPIVAGGSDPRLHSERAPSFIAGAQTNTNLSNELGRGEPSPSIGPAAVTSNANSRVTIEEIEDPEASTSSLSNEQRRMRRADKQKHHGADIPLEEDDIMAQQAILNSIRERNNRRPSNPSDSHGTAPSAQIPESYSGILEAALAHLMSPHHESESEEDFALRMDALRRLRDPDHFNGPSNESSNHVLPQAPNTTIPSGQRGPKSLSMLVESMNLSNKSRSEKSEHSHYAPSLFYEIPANSLTAVPERPAHHKACRGGGAISGTHRASTIVASHVEPTATPLSGTPEIYAPAFTAEVDWQNRVALQQMALNKPLACIRNITLPIEILVILGDFRVSLLILVPTSLKTPLKTRGLTQDLSILKGVDDTLKKSVEIDASDIGAFSELDMTIIIRLELKDLAILIVLLEYLLIVMKIVLEESVAGDWSGE